MTGKTVIVFGNLGDWDSYTIVDDESFEITSLTSEYSEVYHTSDVDSLLEDHDLTREDTYD